MVPKTENKSQAGRSKNRGCGVSGEEKTGSTYDQDSSIASRDKR